MSLVQYQYVVAVDTYRSFVVAAEKCFVTQPTLSMQIQKLENSLGVKLFNRNRRPILPTEVGREIIGQARILLSEYQKIKEIISDREKHLVGELKIGIIPTVAPYILPKIIPQFMLKYPQVKLVVWEQTTDQIVQQLKLGLIDCGILSTLIPEPQLVETSLFFENFIAYVSINSALSKKKTLQPEDIDIEELWILNEGHCMRDQVLNICQRCKDTVSFKHYEYNTGSIETLKRMVDENNGITILPEFALNDLAKSQRHKVRHFLSPKPSREISIITPKSFAKRRLVETLKIEILEFITEHNKNPLNKYKICN